MEASRRLAQLNDEEHSLSTRRARLQDRIDFLRAGGGGPVDEAGELIQQLEREERELSQRRHEVHGQIELARTELRRPRA